MRPVVDPDEMKWRARSDARTLAEAEEIKADKSRMALAQKEGDISVILRSHGDVTNYLMEIATFEKLFN